MKCIIFIFSIIFLIVCVMKSHAKYFSQIDKDGKVIQVAVADGSRFLEEHHGGMWVETEKNNPDKNYAGIGYGYNDGLKNFVSPKPGEDYILNDKLGWECTTPDLVIISSEPK